MKRVLVAMLVASLVFSVAVMPNQPGSKLAWAAGDKTEDTEFEANKVIESDNPQKLLPEDFDSYDPKEELEKARQERKDDNLSYKPGELLVLAPKTELGETKEILEDRDMEILSSTDVNDNMNLNVVKLPENRSVESATSDTQKILTEEIGDADFIVQPNYKYSLSSNTSYNKTEKIENYQDVNAGKNMNIAGGRTSKSSSFWWLNRIGSGRADLYYDKNKPRVKVGLIDTGVDINHPALQKALIKSQSVKIDEKGNVKKLYRDKDQHGTHVAGIIAGSETRNGPEGWHGVGHLSAHIVAVDATEKYEYGIEFYSSTIMQALRYCAKKGCRIINLSITGYKKDFLVYREIQRLYAKNILVIAAAGNGNSPEYASPADYDKVMGVICSNKADRRDPSSNYGFRKCLSAPGTDILSCAPFNNYVYMSGSSMSTAMVTGATASLLQVNPKLKPNEIKRILNSSCDDIAYKGFDQYTGFGRLNIGKAHKLLSKASPSGYQGSISTNISSIRLKKLNTYTIEHAFSPMASKPRFPTVKWVSSNSKVASVDYAGTIRAKNAGKAVISAYIKKGNTWRPAKGIRVTVLDSYTRLKGPVTVLLRRLTSKHSLNSSYETNCLGFKYYGRKGEKIKLVSESSSLDTAMQLRNKNGFPICESWAVRLNNQTMNSDTMVKKLPYTGWYYIEVRPELLRPIKKNKSYVVKLTFVSSRYNTKLSGKRNGKNVKLKWKRLKNANGYKIYKKVYKGEYKRIKTLRGSRQLTYTDRVKRNKSYSYYVRPYVSTLEGRYKLNVGSGNTVWMKK